MKKEYAKTCRVCGEEFTATRSTQIYCCRACKHRRAARVKKNAKPQAMGVCPVCGEEFRQVGNLTYCSAECRKKAQRERARARRSWILKNRPKTCAFCGMSFYPNARNLYYCSAECAREAGSTKKPRSAPTPAPVITIHRPDNELHRLAAQALANGLSYGQYVAMIEMGGRFEARPKEVK